MDRRKAIKNTALIMGGALASGSVLGIMNGCKADPKIGFEPVFLKIKEARIIEALVDRIIPATKTPGAVEAGVPAFLDKMLSEYFPEKEKKIFKDGLVKLDADAKAAFDKPFIELEASQKDELLMEYDTNSYKNPDAEPDFFRLAKELTILGFFTTEIGATEVLYFDPVPENYQGCIDFALVGRSWAT